MTLDEVERLKTAAGQNGDWESAFLTLEKMVRERITPVELVEQFASMVRQWREGKITPSVIGLAVIEQWAAIRALLAHPTGEQRTDVALAACRAALVYDEALRECAGDPGRMASFCSAEGDDLDALYEDWISKSRVALGWVL